MPLYEYQCDACGKRFEIIQRFADAPAETCTICGQGPVQRLLSSPAIQFKGSGWYITDYAQKGKSDSASGAAEKPAEKSDTSGSAAAAKGDTAAGSSSSTTAASTPPKSSAS